jgi:hypothetical protein
MLGVFLLAVIANVLYCAAYLPDVFAEISAYRDLWRKYRWVLFLTGLTFAGVVTRFIAMGISKPRDH